MKKQVSLEALNDHLFETIEMLKNNSSDVASPNEKIDIESAKTIADLGKVIVDGYKVKAQVLGTLAKADNPSFVKAFIEQEKILELPDKSTT